LTERRNCTEWPLRSFDPTADYTLEVRAIIRGGEDVRTGALEATLTVA
jgi:hypothetical protein